ncbi:MAG: Flp pilus assembly protein CpaB [Terriglobia bacterium]
MNRNRIFVGLVIALVVGLVTASFVYKRLQQASVEQPVIAVSHIVVAAAPLPLGSRLRAEDLRLITWPAATALAGSFSRVEDCVDRALTTTVVENEPILAGKLAPKEAGAGLPATIPEGFRAISVRVDDVVAVAGFVTPGTMVDVLVTAEAGGGAGGAGGVTNTILQDVRVLAAGQKVEQDKEGKPQTVSVVTMLVTPEQANKLTMASTDGRIHLALRNTIDTKLVESPPIYMISLLGARPQPAPKAGPRIKATAPRSAPPLVIEVIRGDKKDTATFPAR